MSLPTETDNELLAAETALGVLEGPERDAARERMETDPAFASLVVRWEMRLAALAAPFPSAAPSGAAWPRLQARLGASDRGKGPTAEPVSFRRWRVSLLTAAASLGAAAALGVVVGLVLRPRSTAPMLAAALQPTATSSEVVGVVTLFPTHARVVSAVTRPGVGRRRPELWLIKRGAGPQDLGAAGAPLSPAGAAAVRRARAGDTLAVSLEPPGAPPGPAPAGPVVATGVLRGV